MFILCLLYKTIFQFLVVGAGSAGCVLANRLTADGTKKVLLLEAGGLEGAAVQVPFFSPLLQRTKIDWDYTSEPQQEASLSVDGRINRFPRGKVFGGSSSINHVIYSRGNRKDFDNWASLYGAEGWSYKDVLPDFIKIETSYLGIDNANRPTIKTYGLLHLHTHLKNLLRDLHCNFVIADVAEPIIGYKLIGYNLISDCCKNWLIDATMGRSTPGQRTAAGLVWNAAIISSVQITVDVLAEAQATHAALQQLLKGTPSQHLEKVPIPGSAKIICFNMLTVQSYHGDSGEVPITFPSSHTKASDLFLEAGQELGYSNDDYNGPNQTSFSRVQNNVKNGERWSSSKAFIPNDVRRRRNLDVALHAHVTKVIFEGMTAAGVEYRRYFKTRTVRARKEVILCAGAIASPQLLMLSGIGPREHLESLGINVIADLPVGENLYDHVTVNGIAASSAENIELNYYLPSTVSKYVLFRTEHVQNSAFTLENDVSGTVIHAASISEEALGVEVVLQVVEIYENYYKRKRGDNVIMIVPALLRPKSSGYIRLRSTNPEEYPSINPRFFTDTSDLESLIEGSKIAVQTLTTQAMRNANVTIWDIALPACESAGPVWSESYLRCFVRHVSLSGWHPCCTAPMGTHRQAVLDPRLRVLGGVKNLRVVDASSMPYLTAGNLNSPLMMMGHRAAAMIIEDNS
nr:glucose dehydrogenase [FAD, quinone]-like [Rhipicephalus microplus]